MSAILPSSVPDHASTMHDIHASMACMLCMYQCILSYTYDVCIAPSSVPGHALTMHDIHACMHACIIHACMHACIVFALKQGQKPPGVPIKDDRHRGSLRRPRETERLGTSEVKMQLWKSTAYRFYVYAVSVTLRIF